MNHACALCNSPARVGMFCDECRALGVREDMKGPEGLAVLKRVRRHYEERAAAQQRAVDLDNEILAIMKAQARQEDGPQGPQLGDALTRAGVSFAELCAKHGVDEKHEAAYIEAIMQVEQFKESIGLRR
jgi:hypothetical protein